MDIHEAQNERMRDWFEERTGLKNELLSAHMAKMDEMLAIPFKSETKSACERKLIISIENNTVLFDNINDFNPLEFMGILHNAVSTADVLYKTKVMQMIEKASKSV